MFSTIVRLGLLACEAQPHAVPYRNAPGSLGGLSSGSLPAAFPHHQHEQYRDGWCDFYIGHCTVFFHRHVFDDPKN